MTAPATYTDDQRVDALTRLALNGGNVSKTARELSISRPTLIVWRDHITALNSVNRVSDTIADRAPKLSGRVQTKIEAIAFSELPEQVPVKDQLAAAVWLGRISGLIVDRREVSGPDGGPIQHDVRMLVALRDELKQLLEGAG